ncbi:hypothetical protein BO86DRAFT_39799 [Aspergillus japonicus CBS 114.51]|uniref:Uncharacterized protein n=1 Tax=Aspergillus japonicus CBS 114.51 TaxID=1448312 RepID=A0A8T8X624_ASPJA|nr:hypothetical protein BO86DRAFT_39799 [Aspergillus japonicus CBS 114.51]RAH83475.1 hypothetical protein BO86DRAFT_39799 [Aspergillus japonicus CBS 114.51]
MRSLASLPSPLCCLARILGVYYGHSSIFIFLFPYFLPSFSLLGSPSPPPICLPTHPTHLDSVSSFRDRSPHFDSLSPSPSLSFGPHSLSVSLFLSRLSFFLPSSLLSIFESSPPDRRSYYRASNFDLFSSLSLSSLVTLGSSIPCHPERSCELSGAIH